MVSEVINCLVGNEALLTLQSEACFLARIRAPFLSRSDSKRSTKDCPFRDCQNSDLAAEFPPPLNPHSLKKRISTKLFQFLNLQMDRLSTVI